MRWIIRIIVTLVTLIVVAVAGILLIPTDRIARIAEAQFEENTGRSLTIAGDVRPQLFPRLGVSLEEVTISNAPWAGGDPMVEARALEVGVGTAALIGGKVEVQAFRIEEPVIRLARRADGSANWDFFSELGGEESGGGGGATPDVSLPEGVITNGTIVFDDAASGQNLLLSNVDATLSLDGFDGAAAISMSALMRDQPFKLAAGLTGLQALLDGGLRDVQLTVSAGDNKVDYNGQLGLEPLQAKGQLNAVVPAPEALFALAGQPAPRIPEGLGQRIEVAGGLTLAPDGRIFLRGADIALDQNRLRGDLDVEPLEVPKVTARLVGERLDFSAMSTDRTEADGAANAGAGGWSENRIDASGLAGVNGAFSLKAKSIDLGSIQLGATDIDATLERSRLVTRFTNIEAFDGLVSGQFVVNNRGGLSVGGDMTARGVAMQRLLQDFAGYDRLVADGNLELKFLGVGENMAEIMRSLSGNGKLAVGGGEMLGLDLAGMLRNLDASYRGEGSKTIFDGIAAGFTMESGVMRNDDLSFASKFLTATGAGWVDLGRQTIDYRVVPVALASEIDRGISVPVLITGPWANMKFRPDLKSLIDKELEEEKAKLKAAAKAREAELKAKAEAKIAEELGVARQEGQSLEEQVKDGLEEKAKDALRRLFD